LKIRDLKSNVKLRMELKFIPEEGGRRLEDAIIIHELLPDEAIATYELVKRQLKKLAPDIVAEHAGK